MTSLVDPVAHRVADRLLLVGEQVVDPVEVDAGSSTDIRNPQREGAFLIASGVERGGSRGRGGSGSTDGSACPSPRPRSRSTDMRSPTASGSTRCSRPASAGTPRQPRPAAADSARRSGSRCPIRRIRRRDRGGGARIGDRAWVRVDLTGDGRRQVWGAAVATRSAGTFRCAVPALRTSTIRCCPARSSTGRAPPGSRSSAAAGESTSACSWTPPAGSPGHSKRAVLAVHGGVIQTAPWDGRILASTTLGRLLGHAGRLGIPVERVGPARGRGWDALYVASIGALRSRASDVDVTRSLATSGARATRRPGSARSDLQ